MGKTQLPYAVYKSLAAEKHHSSGVKNKHKATDNRSHQTTTCQVGTDHTWSRDKLLKEHHQTESNNLKRKIRNIKQDFRQHQRNPSDQAITILENSLSALKHTLEQRRTNKLAKLLGGKAQMLPSKDTGTIWDELRQLRCSDTLQSVQRHITSQKVAYKRTELCIAHTVVQILS